MINKNQLDVRGFNTPLFGSTASNDAEKNSESETNNSFHSVQRKAKLPASTGLSEAALLRCADSNEVLMYAKVFAQIFDSSIADDYQLRHFFMDLLVLADLNGVVDMTQSAIAARTRMPLDTVKELLAKLEAPDPESRTTTAQGARIAKLDEHRSWGWFIVNYDKFRKTASEEQRREKTKERTKKWRAGDAPVTPCDAGDAMQRQNQMQTQKEKQRHTKEELLSICKNIGTPNPEQDADGLFFKWEENGWMNGKHKIKNVSLTIQSWMLHGYLPSQKFNMKTQTAPSKFTNVPAQIRAVDEQIRLHIANPNGPRFFSGCTQADKDTLKALRERKAQLTSQLAQG